MGADYESYFPSQVLLWQIQRRINIIIILSYIDLHKRAVVTNCVFSLIKIKTEKHGKRLKP